MERLWSGGRANILPDTENYVIKKYKVFSERAFQQEIKGLLILNSWCKENNKLPFMEMYDSEQCTIKLRKFSGNLDNMLTYLDNDNLQLNTDAIDYIFKQVESQVCYLHENNIAHCDIKTENILIDNWQNITLDDFDITQCEIMIIDFDLCLDFGTIPIEVTGSEVACSPQMLKLQSVNEKYDYWALGCLLWELCTNQFLLECNSSESSICSESDSDSASASNGSIDVEEITLTQNIIIDKLKDMCIDYEIEQQYQIKLFKYLLSDL